MRQPFVPMSAKYLLIEARALLGALVHRLDVIRHVTRLLVTQLVDTGVTHAVQTCAMASHTAASPRGDATGTRARARRPLGPGRPLGSDVSGYDVIAYDSTRVRLHVDALTFSAPLRRPRMHRLCKYTSITSHLHRSRSRRMQQDAYVITMCPRCLIQHSLHTRL